MQLNHVVLPAKFCIIFVWAESLSCANWVTDIKRVGGDAELCQTRWQTSNLSATSSLSVCRTVTMTAHEWSLSLSRHTQLHKHHQHSSLFSPLRFLLLLFQHSSLKTETTSCWQRDQRKKKKIIWVEATS